jgi:hypothetical protein
MPWCESCDRKNLKKEDVVFDDKRSQVLCVPCGQKLTELPGEEVLQGEVFDKLWFGLHYTSDQGIEAEAIYGGARFSVSVSNDQVKRLLRP